MQSHIIIYDRVRQLLAASNHERGVFFFLFNITLQQKSVQNMTLEQQIQSQSQQFSILFDRLSQTQSSESALAQAQSYLIDFQNQLHLTQQNIDKFHLAADKEFKRLVNVKGPSVKHVWLKIRGQLEQRLDEQEKLWLKEFEKCQEEKQHLTILNEQITAAQIYVNQCQQTFQQYTQTKQILDELLESFFGGTTPSYPDEDLIEEKLKHLKIDLSNLQNQHRILSQVCELLQKAHESLHLCHQALNDALNMKTFDIVSNSSFADVAMNSTLARARNKSAQAQRLINQARQIYPDLSFIAELYVQQDNFVFNLVFDNIWTDIHMKTKISETLSRIYHAKILLTNILEEIEHKLEQCRIDRDATNQNVQQLAAEHFNTRIHIVQNIIQKSPSVSSL